MIILAVFGCGSDGAENAAVAPAIEFGRDKCGLCGMVVKDPGYAPILETSDGERLPFDAIECLIQERRQAGGNLAGVEVWLPDLGDAGRLHPESEMVVVQGGFPSPMGGGYAAFKDGLAAEKIADDRGGETGTLMDFITGKQKRKGE